MATVLWDIGRLVWLVTLLAMLICLPALITARARRPTVMSVIDHLAGSALVVIIAVSILSPLRLLNPVTLAVVFACWPISCWVLRHRGAAAREATLMLRRRIVSGAVWWESEHRRHALITSIRTAIAEFSRGLRASGATSGTAIYVVAAAALMVSPRLIEALLNTRLAGTDAYAELVTAQQLLASELGWTAPRPFAASVAALSMASSVAAVHVVRLLPPIIGFATVITLILVVHRSTRGLAAALLAAVLMSLMAPAYARTPGHEFADLFLLLSLLFWQETLTGERKYKWAAVACTAVAAVAAPLTLLVVCVAVGGMLLWPRLTLVVTGAAWLSFLWFANITDTTLGNVPLAAALILGGVFQLAAVAFWCERRARRLAVTAAAAAVVVLAIFPRTSAANYVEYDASARQSLEIAGALPKYRFLIVAPVEQWALTYGRGWHMDLYDFVTAVGGQAGHPGYALPFQVDDVFVFVETRPFAMFEREPQHVSFSVLTDPVFRHYRSLAGRSSLQFAALDTCERLRQAHPGASIYYDDGRLRIYRFSLR